MKLKVGDICKVKTGTKIKCGVFRDNKGKYVKITKIEPNGYVNYDVLNSQKQRVISCSCFNQEDLIPIKMKPIKFIAIYEERNSGDPFITFTSTQQLNKWIKESLDSNVIFSSIEVYEVAKKRKPILSVRLK